MVGHPVTIVSEPVTFLGGTVTRLGGTVTLIGDLVARHGQGAGFAVAFGLPGVPRVLREIARIGASVPHLLLDLPLVGQPVTLVRLARAQIRAEVRSRCRSHVPTLPPERL